MRTLLNWRRPIPLTRRSLLLSLPLSLAAAERDWKVEKEQITTGPRHHFFGYIGHVKNTPWNGDGRYLALLQTMAQDHMPAPDEAADVVLVDTRDRNKIVAIDRTRAWNPQQGSMMYWNPEAAATQLLFNDRDTKTNRLFPVLFDIAKQKRIREYRFDDTPFGNSGVRQNGGQFLAINYGRMARLRPVTGYPGAYDWNAQAVAPDDDGIFLIDIASGKKRLLVSFRQLAEKSGSAHRLFINHTLWNRDGTRIYFYLRGVSAGAVGWDTDKTRLNLPCTIWPDGTNLKVHRQFIGGHPEWESGSRIIGTVDRKQVIYDVDREELVGEIGNPAIFPDPGGDGALSPDGKWFVSGYREGHENRYAILRRSDNSNLQTAGLPIDDWISGVLRLDPAPCWNRTSDTIAVPAIANDAGRTRQTFLIRIRSKR